MYAVWDGKWGRSGMGALDGVAIVEGKGQFWELIWGKGNSDNLKHVLSLMINHKVV